MTTPTLVSDTPANRRVYVANLGDREVDLTDTYGESVYLTQGFVPLYDIELLKTRLRKQLRNATEDDYLILSGSNLLCVIIVDVWHEVVGKCQILHYDTKRGDKHGYRLIEYPRS